jgi:DNA-binding Xre family transcriptional regulator
MPQTTKYKLYLKANNISQREVVKATGKDKGAISNFANNYSNVTLKMIRDLCKFHNCTPNDIIEFEPWLKKDTQDTV